MPDINRYTAAIAYLDEVIMAVEAQPRLGFDEYFDTVNGCACAVGSVALQRAAGNSTVEELWAEFIQPDKTPEQRAVIAEQLYEFVEPSLANEGGFGSLVPTIPRLNDGGPSYTYDPNAEIHPTMAPHAERESEDPVARRDRVLRQLRELRADLFASIPKA